MYRDELATYRERLESARRDADRAWQKVQAELATMAALNGKLAGRQPGGIEPPELAPAATPAPPGPGATAEDYTRLCGETERETERLLGDVAWLRKLEQVLEARTRGRRGALPLGPPPRPVPASYVLAEWLGLPPMVLLFVGIFGAVGLPALVGSLGIGRYSSLLPTLIVGCLLAVLFSLSRSKLRFLATCKQAEHVELLSTASTSSSYKNWNLPVARGWQVSHDSYTGSGTRSSLEYTTDDGQVGSAEVTGRPYESGVVLYDPHTLQGYCVCKFRCAPHPDVRGRWQAGLSTGLSLRVAITALLAAAGLIAPLIGLLLF